MNNSRILFTDLDGTLFDDNVTISSKNRQAIDTLLLRGHRIVITTGRPLVSAELLAKELGLLREGCYIIASNGAVISDAYSHNLLSQTGVFLPDVRYLLDRAYEAGFHAHTYSNTHVLAEHNTPELDWYKKVIRVPSMIVDDVTTYLNFDPVKVLLIYKNGKQKLLDFEAGLADWATNRFESIFSCDYMLEYCPIGVSKGNALLKLCSLLNLPVESTVSIGDADNDASMIEAAHIGCAMCNGSENALAAADYITENDNNHDGFAEAVEKFIL